MGWERHGRIMAQAVILPIVDHWQDLPALAARIHDDTVHQPLALLDPDETTIAMLDHGAATPFTILSSGGAAPGTPVSSWFAAHGPGARVLVLLPGHATGAVTDAVIYPTSTHLGPLLGPYPAVIVFPASGRVLLERIG